MTRFWDCAACGRVQYVQYDTDCTLTAISVEYFWLARTSNVYLGNSLTSSGQGGILYVCNVHISCNPVNNTADSISDIQYL